MNNLHDNETVERVKRPCHAAKLYALFAIISLISTLMMFISAQTVEFANIGFFVFTNLLGIAVNIFLCVVLFAKRNDKILLVALIVEALMPIVLSIFNLFAGVAPSLGIVLAVFARLVTVAFVSIFVSEKADEQRKENAKKYWFVPAIALAVEELPTLVNKVISEVSTAAQGAATPYILVALLNLSLAVLPVILVIVANMMLCKWVVNPYKTVA